MIHFRQAKLADARPQRAMQRVAFGVEPSPDVVIEMNFRRNPFGARPQRLSFSSSHTLLWPRCVPPSSRKIIFLLPMHIGVLMSGMGVGAYQGNHCGPGD